jgi:hypothetical protein
MGDGLDAPRTRDRRDFSIEGEGLLVVIMLITVIMMAMIAGLRAALSVAAVAVMTLLIIKTLKDEDSPGVAPPQKEGFTAGGEPEEGDPPRLVMPGHVTSLGAAAARRAARAGGAAFPPAPYPGAVDAEGVGGWAETTATPDRLVQSRGGRYEVDRAGGPAADDYMAAAGLRRNDTERVTLGTMDRRRWIDQYVREEVNEEEQAVWWGRGEE